MDQEAQDEISLEVLFAILRRGLWPVLAVAVLLAGTTYFVSGTFEPGYRARATILAAQTNPAFDDRIYTAVTAPPIDVNAYRAAAQSDVVLTDALKSLGNSQPDQRDIVGLRHQLHIRTEDTRTSSLLHIEAKDSDPQAAADIVNAVADALLAWDQARAGEEIADDVHALEEQIAALDKQIADLQASPGTYTPDQLDGRIRLRATLQQQLYYSRVLSAAAKGMLDIIQVAPAPLRPVSPKPARDAALALVVGIFLGYAVFFVNEALTSRLRDTDDLAVVSGLPILGEFPRLPKGTRRLPREASSYLRTNLLFATPEAHPKIILVTSPQSAEGKSSIALSLAESFARSEYKTLLVDADLRKPVIAAEFKLSPPGYPSLQDFLENPLQSFEVGHVPLSLKYGLDIVPTFHQVAAPSELLTRGFHDALDRWRNDYDAIIIDSAPVLPVADTLPIAPFTTGVVLAASLKSTDRRPLRASVELLQRIGVRLLGVAATQVENEGRRGKQGYGYGYGYGEAEREQQVAFSRERAVGHSK